MHVTAQECLKLLASTAISSQTKTDFLARNFTCKLTMAPKQKQELRIKIIYAPQQVATTRS